MSEFQAMLYMKAAIFRMRNTPSDNWAKLPRYTLAPSSTIDTKVFFQVSKIFDGLLVQSLFRVRHIE